MAPPATPDYYALLSVPEHCTPQQLRSAWQKVSKQYHPDRYPSPAQKKKANQRLAVINQAYEVLSDPRQRKAYDAMRKQSLMHIPVGNAPVEVKVGGPGMRMQNRRLPHRYTPGSGYVTFDGVTYLSLEQASVRVTQPVERLRWYIENKELNALEFDNQYWVTEASLLPIRNRHKPHSIGLLPWGPKPSPEVWSRARHVPGMRPERPSNRLDRKFDAPKIDRKAEPVLNLAPTVLLLFTFGILYGYLANFSSLWPQLQRLPQVLGL